MGRNSEIYWLDETDPQELRRRANDLNRDGFSGLASQLRQRALELEIYYEACQLQNKQPSTCPQDAN